MENLANSAVKSDSRERPAYYKNIKTKKMPVKTVVPYPNVKIRIYTAEVKMGPENPAPVVNVLLNTLGEEITWSILGSGTFRLQKTTDFTNKNTAVFVASKVIGMQMTSTVANGSVSISNTTIASGEGSNIIDPGTIVEIRVYEIN